MQKQLKILKNRFKNDTFAQSLGIVLDQVTEGTVEMHMQLQSGMNNWFGQLHGGAIYTLADAAFSILANNRENIAVALECSITYHASPEPDTILIVKGEILSRGQRTAAYLFKIFMKKEGALTLIATMKSVSYRTNKPISLSIAP